MLLRLLNLAMGAADDIDQPPAATRIIISKRSISFD